MALIERKALECGAPGCHEVRVFGRDEPARGIAVTMQEHHSTGGVSGVKAFACSREHLELALLTALDEEWDG